LNLNTLKQIRQQIYQCCQQSRDAFFELTDALSSESCARSLPELSLSPFFRRTWARVYETLEDGKVDATGWTSVWTQALLEHHEGPVWVSIDSTSIARPEAETSPDRGMIYLPNLPHATKPVSVGWQFSTVMLLPDHPSSWGAVLSQRRITSAETAVSVAVQQVESLRPLLPESARLLADRWYVTGPFVSAWKLLHLGALMRLKRNRKLYRPTPPRQAREVEVTVFRVLRERATGTKRDPRESWFVWVGEDELELSVVALTYRRRFSHEHSYRFLKQDLLWTKVHVRTAEQFERWSMVVATAMNQLVLACGLGLALYRPWERRRHVVTPRQVRRVMPAILQQLGTPARVPKPRGKSPGWRKGTPRTRPSRFEVIRKPKPVPKTHRKGA
jgi:hypothetical protein